MNTLLIKYKKILGKLNSKINKKIVWLFFTIVFINYFFLIVIYEYHYNVITQGNYTPLYHLLFFLIFLIFALKKRSLRFAFIFVTILFSITIFLILFFYQPFYQKFLYQNNNLGYELKYKNSWRLLSNLSFQEDRITFSYLSTRDIGCFDEVPELNLSLLAGNISDEEFDLLQTEVGKCVDKNKTILNEKIKKFDSEWSINKSRILYIADWKEVEKFKEMVPGEYDGQLLGNMMVIKPLNIALTFKEKEAIPTSDGRYLATTFVELSNGIKAYTFDTRDYEENGTLLISIPHSYNNDTFLIDFKTLLIETSVAKGSKAEEDFYDIVNSLVLYK